MFALTMNNEKQISSIISILLNVNLNNVQDGFRHCTVEDYSHCPSIYTSTLNLNFLSKAALDAPRFACYTKDAQDIECIKAILYFGITFIPKSPLIHRKIVNALHHSLFIPTARAKALEARIGQFPKSSSLQLGSKCS